MSRLTHSRMHTHMHRCVIEIDREIYLSSYRSLIQQSPDRTLSLTRLRVTAKGLGGSGPVEIGGSTGPILPELHLIIPDGEQASERVDGRTSEETREGSE